MQSLSYERHDRLATLMGTPVPSTVGPSADWRVDAPVLTGRGFTLREFRDADAPALLALLGTREVNQYLTPPPSTVEGFRGFIRWTQEERAAGRCVCFGVVPDGFDAPVGFFQVRALDGAFANAEWGFVMGSAFWGSGLFRKVANLVLEFTFDVIGAHRLEARSVVQNARGNGALRKLGAVQEGILRESFVSNGVRVDQVLWAILDDEWRQCRVATSVTVH